MALTEEGEVYSWGRNQCGQLGLRYRVEYVTTTKLERIPF